MISLSSNHPSYRDLRGMILWARRNISRFTTYCIYRPHLHIELLVVVRGILGIFPTFAPASSQLLIVTVGSGTLAFRCFRIAIVAWSAVWWIPAVLGFDSPWMQWHLEKKKYGVTATTKVYALLHALVYFIGQGALSVVLEEFFAIFRWVYATVSFIVVLDISTDTRSSMI